MTTAGSTALVASLVLLAASAALAEQPDRQRPPHEPAQTSAAAGATAPSPAVVDPREAQRLFNRFDTDRDGRLSEAELDAARANQGNWLAIDRNRDGRIERGEFTALGAR